ncbi:MAG: hypothetical protein HY860_04435 [Chlamydiales bacterium]|nr:hypothetical protein [Chlamydiales bacterium]
MRKLVAFSCTMLIGMMTLCNGAPTSQKMEMEPPPRILKLIPDLVIPFTIEPAIPENFVAMSPHGEVNAYDWIYWGPKDVLEDYFSNKVSPKEPILRTKLSANMSQEELEKEKESDLKQDGVKVLSYSKLKWGVYPVRSYSCSMGRELYMAHAGLNSSSGSWTLLFNLVYSEKETKPSKEALDLWKTFLEKTTVLEGKQVFRAMGLDLRLGLTLVDAKGSQLQAVAQRRKSDNKLKIAVTSIDSDTEFKFTRLEEKSLLTQWHYGSPLASIFGTVTKNSSNVSFVQEYEIPVLIETVDDFISDASDPKKPTMFVYFK